MIVYTLAHLKREDISFKRCSWVPLVEVGPHMNFKHIVRIRVSYPVEQSRDSSMFLVQF